MIFLRTCWLLVYFKIAKSANIFQNVFVTLLELLMLVATVIRKQVNVHAFQMLWAYLVIDVLQTTGISAAGWVVSLVIVTDWDHMQMNAMR